jgi:hypothetical protein
MSATVVVATHLGGARLERLLDSLTAQTLQVRTIVVDDASPGGVAALVAPHEFAEQLRLEQNVSFGRAVNLGRSAHRGRRARARERRLRLRAVVRGGGDGRARSGGGRRDGRGPAGRGARPGDDRHGGDGARRDPARLRLPERRAGREPVGGDASTDRTVRGRRRVRPRGVRRGTGFGSGYVLRKWSVLDSRRRAARARVQAGILCAGQALFDRTLAGVRGRLDGYAAAAQAEPLPYPEAALRQQPRRRAP